MTELKSEFSLSKLAFYALTAALLAFTWRQKLELRLQLEMERLALNVTARNCCRDDILIFNRVPKVGSQSINHLIGLLRERNNFTGYTDIEKMPLNLYGGETVYLPNPTTRREAVKSLSENDYPKPFAFLKHQNFFDFAEFGYQSPIYINFVRHPVERFISWHYYIRQPWYLLDEKNNGSAFKHGSVSKGNGGWPWSLSLLKEPVEDCVRNHRRGCRLRANTSIHHDPGMPDYPSQAAFFCGHSVDVCDRFESDELLARAMTNVDKYFAVVGVLEEWQKSLAVLEGFLPRYFAGARELLAQDKNENARHVNKNIFKPKTDKNVKKYLSQIFANEMVFYEFCKKRLHRQFMLIESLN